eukprot:2174031-Amphidinium_carterae.1
MADRDVVLAAVQKNGYALQYATEALRDDREVVLAAVQENGWALQYATETLKSDSEVVLAAVQQHKDPAFRFAADCLLQDPTFATEAKRRFHLLKLTMLSGRSTVVAAAGYWKVGGVLVTCQERLGLTCKGTTMELWHGSEKLPADNTDVEHWPGIQPCGEISEYPPP